MDIREKNKKLKKDLFLGKNTNIKRNESSNYNVVSDNREKILDDLRQKGLERNKPILESIRHNLKKCSIVNKEYKTLNKEFNYTINVIINMVNLIENNGKLISEIEALLREFGADFIKNDQLELMRRDQRQLIEQFKSTYRNLITKNRKYIDDTTYNKINTLLKGYEKSSDFYPSSSSNSRYGSSSSNSRYGSSSSSSSSDSKYGSSSITGSSSRSSMNNSLTKENKPKNFFFF